MSGEHLLLAHLPCSGLGTGLMAKKRCWLQSKDPMGCLGELKGPGSH